MSEITNKLKLAKKATRIMQSIDKKTKEKALLKISEALIDNKDYIIEENKKDLANAEDNGISEAMKDRLMLNDERLASISNDVKKVINLVDPIGSIVRTITRPNGLLIKQVRIPLGVIGVIYESRPNVTVDIASLCIKTNNVCVLKGGKEAVHSNTALVKVMNEAIKEILPDNCITLIITKDHKDSDEIIKAHDYLDVIIPRGSANLINYVVSNASVPVIETGAGICHLYVDKDVDLKMAYDIAINAKIQRPSVCNSIETILIHQNVANEFLEQLNGEFTNKVKVYGDDTVCNILGCDKATTKNYATEYDDYICNIKVVKDVNEAVEHIYQYSTKHSESIITNDDDTAKYFMEALDSACVYHNASTRFTDGGEFGFGAEVGISTQKLHARGPLGLQEITSTKYLIFGKGQVRE